MLRVWLSYVPERVGDLAGSTVKSADALGVGQEVWFEWRSSDESLPLPDQNEDYDVVAEYMDIYGQTFRSKVVLLRAGQSDFSFTPVRNVEGQKESDT